MKNGSSNGGVGRRRGGPHGSKKDNGKTNNNNNKNKGSNHHNASNGNNNAGNSRSGKQNPKQNTQRPNQSSNQSSSNGSQRPANARNMTGANAATTSKARPTTNGTASPSNTSNKPITTDTKPMPFSYAAALSGSSSGKNHQLPKPPQDDTIQTQIIEESTTQQNHPSEPNSTKLGDSTKLGESTIEESTQQNHPLEPNSTKLGDNTTKLGESTIEESTQENHPSEPNSTKLGDNTTKLGESTIEEPTQQDSTKLGDSTILASNYVPEYLKKVMYLNVQHGYQARKLPDTMEHCNRTYFELVPHPSQLPPPPITIIFPSQEMTMVPLDPYFAIRPENKQRRLKPQIVPPQETASKPIQPQVDTTSSQPPEQQQQQQVPPENLPQQQQPLPSSQPKQQFVPRTIPRLENAKGREEYLHTFRLLLQEEFEEKMMLYERYTQFEAIVNPTGNARAILSIPGISNARPALEPGDEVLIRPQPLRKRGKKVIPMDVPISRLAQVHAQVVRVIRGTWKKNKMTDDKVVITWLETHMKKLMHNRLVCVRFLPSSITLHRTLEALLWLERLHPLVAQQLLFPTETPKLPISGDSADDMHDLMLAHAPTEMDYTTEKNGGSGTTTDAPTTGPKLNEKQSRFVHMVLKRTRHPSRGMVRPPMILTGPAGTGKTKALLTSIIRTLQQDSPNGNSTSDTTTNSSNNGANTSESNPMGHPRLPKKHILVCAPSHTACDVITRRLSKSLSPQQLFRLYPSSRPIEMVPAEMLPYVRMKQNEETEFILPPAQELLSFEVIVCTCSDAHLLTMAGLTNSRMRMRRQLLQNWALNILQMGNMQISGGEIVGAADPHFTHLFIDEAAQATEPESLIPLSVVVDDAPDSVKVEIALAGDPRQLSPDVYSPLAALDLQKSLLERLLRLPEVGGRAHMMGPPTGESWTSMSELIEYSFQKKEDHDHLSVFLTTSYRGHPSFLMMPSKLFYFDKLRSANPFWDSVDNKWCKGLRKLEAASSNVNPEAVNPDAWPIHFRGVLGTDQSTAVESFLGSNSWSNPVEANEIVGIVETLVSEGISTASIGIMGAFRGQVILIRRLLRQNGLGAVNVGIVEDYQAVERDVIIVSLTRSNGAFLPADMEQRVGLFQQAKRMNVALTRAENLLVVVGDPVMMEQDQVWKQWLEFCYHHGFWYGTKGEKSSIS